MTSKTTSTTNNYAVFARTNAENHLEMGAAINGKDVLDLKNIEDSELLCLLNMSNILMKTLLDEYFKRRPEKADEYNKIAKIIQEKDD